MGLAMGVAGFSKAMGVTSGAGLAGAKRAFGWHSRNRLDRRTPDSRRPSRVPASTWSSNGGGALGPGLGLAAGVVLHGPSLVRVEDRRGRLHNRRHHLDVGEIDVLDRAPGHVLDGVIDVDDLGRRRGRWRRPRSAGVRACPRRDNPTSSKATASRVFALQMLRSCSSRMELKACEAVPRAHTVHDGTMGRQPAANVVPIMMDVRQWGVPAGVGRVPCLWCPGVKAGIKTFSDV